MSFIRVMWTAMLASAAAMAFAAPAFAQDSCDPSSPTCIPATDFDSAGNGNSIEQSQSSTGGGSIQQQDDHVDDVSISAGGDIDRSQISVTDQRVGGVEPTDDDDGTVTSRVRILARTGPNVLPIVLIGLLCLAGGLALRRSSWRSASG